LTRLHIPSSDVPYCRLTPLPSTFRRPLAYHHASAFGIIYELVPVSLQEEANGLSFLVTAGFFGRPMTPHACVALRVPAGVRGNKLGAAGTTSRPARPSRGSGESFGFMEGSVA